MGHCFYLQLYFIVFYLIDNTSARTLGTDQLPENVKFVHTAQAAVRIWYAGGYQDEDLETDNSFRAMDDHTMHLRSIYDDHGRDPRALDAQIDDEDIKLHERDLFEGSGDTPQSSQTRTTQTVLTTKLPKSYTAISRPTTSIKKILPSKTTGPHTTSSKERTNSALFPVKEELLTEKTKIKDEHEQDQQEQTELERRASIGLSSHDKVIDTIIIVLATVSAIMVVVAFVIFLFVYMKEK